MDGTALFEPPAESVMTAASVWVTNLLIGDFATGLCVIAVAVLGFSTLQGKVAIRRSARVLIGIFLLVGAPNIAASLLQLSPSMTITRPPSQTFPPLTEPAPLNEPRSNPFDPYAGASLPQVK